MRIAILAHSTNPRGGVVHALALAEALCDLGHAAVVHAPAPGGRGFFRPTRCATVPVPAAPAPPDTAAMVAERVAAYVRHFEDPRHRRFDVFHAQDSISGNALATLAARGLIARHARTVHHVDTFRDERLTALQSRAIRAADHHFAVSRHWRDRLAATFGLDATVVGNGVDADRFRPEPDGREAALRQRLRLGSGPVLLAVGGIEPRKNTLTLLEAFVRFGACEPQAQLVIAGGASLLDHDAYRARFDAAVAARGLPEGALVLAGPVPEAEMPALYRVADALVFPSLTEGFGLVALEAMASGTPVVVSAVAPFTELFDDATVVWCDPVRPDTITAAMRVALRQTGARTRAARALSRTHTWQAVAQAHLATYAGVREPIHA